MFSTDTQHEYAIIKFSVRIQTTSGSASSLLKQAYKGYVQCNDLRVMITTRNERRRDGTLTYVAK